MSPFIVRCGKAVLVCWLVLLSTGPALAENRIELDSNPACRIDAEATEGILALINRVSAAWERDAAAQLAAMIPNGTLSAPGQPALDSRGEIEAAISKQLSRPIYKGSRLEIVLRCFEHENASQPRATARGTWTISRFYGEESAAGGAPMPRHLMPPTAGGFVTSLIRTQTTWVIKDLRLELDSRR